MLSPKHPKRSGVELRRAVVRVQFVSHKDYFSLLVEHPLPSSL